MTPTETFLPDMPTAAAVIAITAADALSPALGSTNDAN
jgi:hypothetical protein